MALPKEAAILASLKASEHVWKIEKVQTIISTKNNRTNWKRTKGHLQGEHGRCERYLHRKLRIQWQERPR